MTRRLLAAAVLWLLTAGAVAHELEANRLTLVLRDAKHLSLTYLVDYGAALHRALAPQRPFREFLLAYAAMSPPDFVRELSRAQAKFQAGTRLLLPGGAEIAPVNWRWPDAGRVQAELRERAMQAVVAPGEHAHAPAVEIRAEAVSPRDVDSLTIRLPQEFGNVLVVSYRPSQAWVRPGAPTPVIRF